MNRLNKGPVRHDVNARIDLAVHDVSIVQYLFNKIPKKIHWRDFKRNPESATDDSTFGLIEYDNFFLQINASWEYPFKNRECIFFKDPALNKKDTYIFSNCKIFVESVSSSKTFFNISDHENIMFLNGGIMADQEGILVASPGDVIAAHIVKRLLGTFDRVHPKTVIMIIKSLDAKI